MVDVVLKMFYDDEHFMAHVIEFRRVVDLEVDPSHVLSIVDLSFG
jgi:hypothetical protein